MKTKLMLPLLFFITVFHLSLSAQYLTVSPDGGNKKASVSEQIGITKITIDYGRPAVKGREGKIWGTNVAHYGLKDFGTGGIPWRAGANENTVISFSEDVKVEGKELPAGSYGLFIILGESESTFVFSKNYTSWGSFTYNPAEDALRVTVKNQVLEKSIEWLKYEFMEQTENSASIAMMWEKRMIPFKVELDLVKIQMASFRKEFRSLLGYAYQPYYTAAQFCLQHNVELEQALEWSEIAIARPYVGVKNFSNLNLKASILDALNRKSESLAVMQEAIEVGSLMEVHQYARTLQSQKKNKEAFAVYKRNYEKHSTEFTAMVGLGRGYSAVGDYKNALKYMKQALPKAPNEANKGMVQGMIKKLEEGKDANG